MGGSKEDKIKEGGRKERGQEEVMFLYFRLLEEFRKMQLIIHMLEHVEKIGIVLHNRIAICCRQNVSAQILTAKGNSISWWGLWKVL